MITQSKNAARTEVRRRLDALSHGEYLRMSEQARMNLSTFLSALKATNKQYSVLCYTANLKWKEVDLLSVMKNSPDAACDHLPQAIKTPFPDTLYDIILIPLYGFNAEGYRLGHGAGWYDQFLIRQPQALKAGVGLELSHTDFVIDSHDVRLDAIITEGRILQLGRAAIPS